MPRRTRYETNTEKIARIMNASNLGPLAQVFVMHCVQSVARTTAETPLEGLKKAWMNGGMISAEAWHEIATGINALMQEGPRKIHDDDFDGDEE